MAMSSQSDSRTLEILDSAHNDVPHMEWNPYVQCRARTVVFFENDDEVTLMVQNYSDGSIFWSADGKLTQTAKNVYLATSKGLGYDLAADLFVCGSCRSASPNISYFKIHACNELMAGSIAFIENHSGCTRCVDAFPIMPAYATVYQENEILAWMDETEKGINYSTIEEIQKEIHYENKKTHERVTEVVTQLVPSYTLPDKTGLSKVSYQVKPTNIRTYKEKQIRMRMSNIVNLVTQVSKLCEEQSIPLEYISKKRNKSKKFLKIPMKHTMGYRKNEVDPEHDIPEYCQPLLEHLVYTLQPTRQVNDLEIQRGWSGVVLKEEDCAPNMRWMCVDGLFVVLGRCSHGEVQNALRPRCVNGIQLYGPKQVNRRVPKYHLECDTSAENNPMHSAVWKFYKEFHDVHDFNCSKCLHEYKTRDDMSRMAIIGDVVKFLTESGFHKEAGDDPTMEFFSNHLDFLPQEGDRDGLARLKRQVYRDLIVSTKSLMQGGSLPYDETSQLHGKFQLIDDKQPTQLVDFWRTLQHSYHIVNRKIFLPHLTDVYGNFDFFPNSSLPEIFPDQTFPVTHKLNDDGEVETNFRFVDRHKKVRTCMEGLYTKYDPPFWIETAKEIHRTQPLHQCDIRHNENVMKVCHWEGNVALYYSIIRPTPRHLSFGTQNRLFRIQDWFRASDYVPKNGFCYLYIFACAMQFCDSSNRSNVDEFIRRACNELGPWPTFRALLRKLNHMATYYGAYDALVPVILVDHITRTLHVPTPFGMLQAGMHYIRVSTLKELVDLDLMGEGPIKDYKIGGFKEAYSTISKVVTSKKEFLRKLNSDPEWLVDMMLEPSLLYTLASLVEAHQVVLADVGHSFDKLSALLNIRDLGKQLHAHLTTQQRVRKYMNLMVDNSHLFSEVINSANMRMEIFETIKVIERAIIDDNALLDIDRIDGKKKILEGLDACRANCVYNELVNSFSWHSWYGTNLRLQYSIVGKAAGAVLSFLNDNYLINLLATRPRLSWPNWNITGKLKTGWTTISGLCSRVYAKIVANGMLTACITFSMIFGAIILKKIMKYIKSEKVRSEELEIVEYQAKGKEDMWITRFMATCYIVSALFSWDISDCIYSSMVKFRTIFDILKVNCEFQSGSSIFSKLQEQLGDIPSFHTFTIYNHNDTFARTECTPMTFERWVDNRVSSGQVGYTPLDGQHQRFELTKDTLRTVAAQVVSSQNSEILIEGQVGCGKSTYFPAEISKSARVLILEPTRVLVTNLQESLSGLLNIKAGARMRGHCTMSASNITIMTYGYALVYLFSGPYRLEDYDYIMFDEVHHACDAMIVLYNWLKQIAWRGKLVKLTATPNNVSSRFDTQHAVEIVTWPSMSVQTFAKEQGTSSKHDAATKGRIILVFLTTFREIDEAFEIMSKSSNGRFGLIRADSRHLRDKTNLSEMVSMMHEKNIYILATNIVQNGININADVVVCFGQKIVAAIDDNNRMLTTKRVAINKADRIQRLGRVGRMKKGYAIKIGSEIDNSFEIDEVTATQAALMSFGYGVPPVITNVNLLAFSSVTAEQVKTASQFEMPLAYMVHMVNKDGSMARPMFEMFKSLMLITGKVNLTKYICQMKSDTQMRTIGQYCDLGYMRTDENLAYPIPYHCKDVSDSFAVRLGKATYESKFPEVISMRVPAVDIRETAVKLSTNEQDLGMVLSLVEQALEHEREKLNGLEMSLSSYQSNSSWCILPNFNLQGKLIDSIARIRQNVNVLSAQKNKLENATAAKDFEELVKVLEENPSVASHVMYQSGPSKFIDKELLGKRDYKWAPYLALGAACIMSTGAWYVLYKRNNDVEKCVRYEGKQSRLKDNKRQRGRDAKETKAEEAQYVYYDQGDVMYDGMQDWASGQMDWTDRIRKKSNQHAMQFGRAPVNKQVRQPRPFNHFYGFDASAYDKVTFTDVATNFSVEQSAKNYDLLDAFTEMAAHRGELNEYWDQQRPTKIRAVFEKNGEEIVKEVNMVPHIPEKVNKRGLPVGYVANRGEFRQGAPAVDKPKSTLNPNAAQFESKAMYKEARPIDHLFQNQVIITNPIQSLCGLVTGNKLLVPYHLARGVTNDYEGKLMMMSRFGCYNLEAIQNSHVTKFTMVDLVGYQLPSTFQPRRKLKCFREPVDGERAMMLSSKYENSGWQTCVSPYSEITENGNDGGALWVHHVSTDRGCCGSIFVAESDMKIVGFHSIGAIGRNYFTPVTAEIIAFINDECELPLVPWQFSDEQVDIGTLIPDNDGSKFPIKKPLSRVQWQSKTMAKYCGKGFKMIAEAPAHLSKKHVITGKRPEFQRFLNSNAKWRSFSSPLLGKLQPSALTTEAYYKDVLKYDKPIMIGTVDEDCFAEAVVLTIQFLEGAGFVKHGCKALFDVGTIVNDLNLDAAMGALYTGKKKDYFEEASLEEIEELFVNSAAKLGNNGHGIWSALLKAELRPAAKVVAQKTRTFTSAPIDTLLGAKVVVDSFNKQFYTAHLKGPWTVGINKFNAGWNLLAESLSKYTHYIDADGSQFDSSITPLLMNAVLNIRLYFLENDEEARSMLKNLYTQIIHTCILIGDGTVVQKFRGNNSGQPGTVVDNTLCLMIAVEYARLRAEKDFGEYTEMLYVCNGDDLLINANEPECRIIQERFKDYIKELELNYTFDDVYNSIEDVEYMSHTFMKYQDMYIPKLAKHRVIAILEWQRSTEPQAIQSAITAAYVEAFGYEDLMEMIEEFSKHMTLIWNYKLPPREDVENLYLRGCNNILSEEIEEMCNQYCIWEAGDEILNAANNGTNGTQQSSTSSSSSSSSSQQLQTDAQASQGDGSGTRQAGVQAAGKTEESGKLSTGDKKSDGDKGKGKTDGSSSSGKGSSLLDNPVKNGNGNNSGGGDIADRTPGITFPTPKRVSKAIYIPPSVKAHVTESQVAKVKKYLPRAEMIDNRYATFAQLDNWMDSVAAEYDMTKQTFIEDVLFGWIVHCIINTCSEENIKMEKWRAVNNVGEENETQVLYDIAPMYEQANPSMRGIMRHFGDMARLIISESLARNKPIIPRGFDKAGVLSVDNIIAACDFIIRKPGDTAQFVQVQNQVLVNRVGGIKTRLFAQAKPSTADNVDGSRHDAQDVTENVHEFRGSQQAF
nr:polyprotein [Wheat eqlid mosaic virus]WAB51703.1 polyprotein [Wheat eqlid mosaic virus]WAB51704.1 polyprotein [Wheat eqlid mosaic virus]